MSVWGVLLWGALAAILIVLIYHVAIFNYVLAWLVAKVLGALSPKRPTQTTHAPRTKMSVRSTRGGLVITDLHLDSSRFNKADSGVLVQDITCSGVHISYPTFRSPATININGAHVILQQNQMPMRGDVKAWNSKESHMLRALEGLLWHGPQQAPSRLHNIIQTVVKLLIAHIMRNIVLDVRNTVVQFQQLGQPGPSVGVSAECQDAVRVSVRTAVLAPNEAIRHLAPEETHQEAEEAQMAQQRGLAMRELYRVMVAAQEYVQRVRLHGRDAISSRVGGSTKLAIAGVEVKLMTRATPVTQEQREPPAAGQAATQSPAKGLRVRQTARARRLGPKPQATSQEPVAPKPEWDTVHCILQQWGVDAVVTLGHSPVICVTPKDAVLPQVALRVFGSLASTGRNTPDDADVGGVRTASVASGRSRVSETGPGDLRTASTAAGAAAGAAAAPSGDALLGLHVHVCITLKSLVPMVSPDAALVALRLADRFITYNKYATFWKQRPTVSVKQAPAMWWQHAGRAVLADCRSRYPTRKTEQTLQMRREYIRLYRLLHARQRYFLSGDFETEKSDSEKVIQARLRDMETKLTLGQAMVYRLCVALQHSKYLDQHDDMYDQWVSVMDLVTMFVDALPLRDNEDNDKPSALSIEVKCPRVGLELTTRSVAVAASAAGAATGPGPARSVDGKKAASVEQQPVSQVLLSVEGLYMKIPDVRHLELEAASIRLCPSQAAMSDTETADQAAPCILSIPASSELLQSTGPRFNFARGHGIPNDPPPVWHKQLLLPSLNPEAPISAFLKQYTVQVAPLDLSITRELMQPLQQFGLAFAQLLTSSRQVSKHSKIQLFSSSRGDSLHKMVVDSYVRCKTKVPSLLSSFLPKLQVMCPRVTVRYQLDNTNSVELPAKAGSTELVFCVSNMDFYVRYHRSVFGALCQRNVLRLDAEAYFNMQQAPTDAASALGHYTKLWLHPSDVDLLYKLPAFVPQTSGNASVERMPSKVHPKLPSHVLESWSTSDAPNTSRHRSAPPWHPAPTVPFVPVMLARQIASMTVRQVPFEPSVPGFTTTHMSVGMGGMQLWFSPWQMDLILGLVDSILANPVLTMIQQHKKQHKKQDPKPSTMPTTQDVNATNSKFSFLVDMPWLSVLAFASIPDVPACADGSKAGLYHAPWVNVAMKLDPSDPALLWGQRLAPWVALQITDTRAGMVMDAQSSSACVSAISTHVSNLQIRYRTLRIWGRNSSTQRQESYKRPSKQLHTYVLTPLTTRAEACAAFARDRRRTLMGFHWRWCETEKEARGIRHCIMLQAMERYMLLKAADFASFLLTRDAVPPDVNPMEWYLTMSRSTMEPGPSAPDSSRGAHMSMADLTAGMYSTGSTLRNPRMPAQPAHRRAPTTVSPLRGAPVKRSKAAHRRNNTMIDMLMGVKNGAEHQWPLFRGALFGQAKAGIPNKQASETSTPTKAQQEEAGTSAATPGTAVPGPSGNIGGADPGFNSLGGAPSMRRQAQPTSTGPWQLSFVQSFSHLRRSVRQGLDQQVVSRTPFHDPNVQLVFQGPCKGSANPSQLRLSVHHLRVCISTCSMVTLQMLIKSLNRVVAKHVKPKPQAARIQAPKPSARGYPNIQVDVVVGGLHAQLIVEESPGIKRPGSASEVLSATVLGAATVFKRARPAADVVGMVLDASVQQLLVHDLMSCVEHRRVLCFEPDQVPKSNPHKTPFAVPGLLTPHEPNDSISVTLSLPVDTSVPVNICVALCNPRVLFLRKFLQNVLYAVHKICEMPKGCNEDVPHPPTEHKPHTPSTSSSYVTIQATGLQLVLPAASTAKAGPIKHAIFNQAVLLNIERLQAGLPGNWDVVSEKLEHCCTEDILAFFMHRGFELEEWMMSEPHISHLFDTSGRIVQQHSSSSQPSKHGGAAAGAGAAGLDATRMSTAAGMQDGDQVPERPEQVTHWQKLRQTADRVVVKPLKQMLADAKKMAVTTNQVEAGMLFMDMDLSNQAHNKLQFTETVQRINLLPSKPSQAQQVQARSAIGSQPVGGAAAAPGTSGSALMREVSSGADGGMVQKLAASRQQRHVREVHRHLQPVVFFSINHATGHACTLETGHVPQELLERAQAVAGSLEETNLLKALSTWSVSGLHPLIQFADLQGCFLFNGGYHPHGMQLHISALGDAADDRLTQQTSVTLGPDSYDRLIRICTGNFTEGKSSFEPTLAAPPPRKYNTAFASNLAFGPPPNLEPFFALTTDFPKLQGTLVNDPAWWGTSLASAANRQHRPVLRLVFTDSSFSFQMAKDGAMYIGFQSHEAECYDIRTTPQVVMPPSMPDESSGNRVQSWSGWRGTTSADGTGKPEPGRMSLLTRSSANSWKLRDHNSRGRGMSFEHTMGADSDGSSEGSAAYLDADEADDLFDTEGDEHGYPPLILKQSVDGHEVRAISLIHASSHIKMNEALHMPDQGSLPDVKSHCCFKLLFTMLADGTMANEVDMCHTVVQWPFLTDMSLVSAIVSVFQPTWCTGPPPFVNTLQLNENYWFYFNLVLRQSQFFVPILSGHLAKLAEEVNRPAADLVLSWENLKQIFQRAAAVESRRHTTTASSLHLGNLAGSPSFNLEESGLAISTSVFRLGYFMGGHGSSELKVDLRNSAGFVRHQGACVTNFLLPIKTLAFAWKNDCPRVEECQQLLKYIMLGRTLTFWWRVCLRAKRKAQAQRQEKGMLPSGSGLAATIVKRSGNSPDDEGSSRRDGHDASKKPHEQLLDMAWARARELLLEHGIPLPEDSKALQHGARVDRKRALSSFSLEVDTCSVRAAFSHIPLWQALMKDVQLVTQHMFQGPGMFPIAKHVVGEKLDQVMQPVQQDTQWHFRRVIRRMDVQLKGMSIVLCNDKLKSFGAPDVLQACANQLMLAYTSDMMMYGHQPQQTGSLDALLSVNFLNNSSSSWEVLVEPWPVSLLLSNPINKIFKNSRTTYIGLQSQENLKVLFHPASLLTIGDTLAFTRELSEQPADNKKRAQRFHVVEKAFAVEEQMGLGTPITARVPQRYLIQNQTGMVMWYWRPALDGSTRQAEAHMLLPNGTSEELKVQPLHKTCKMVGPGGVLVTRMRCGVINLQFEGNWMPLTDVSTDVVGKYCYYLDMPLEDRRVPIIVDVALIGRTKIIKLHSALWVQNGTTTRLGFKLHLPSSSLAKQIISSMGDMALSDQDIKLRSLKPGEGRYLPVVACLDGVLYLEPRNCMAAQHDAIRLSPDVASMPLQQGYICCQPLDPTGKLTTAMHFSVKVKVKNRMDWNFGTHHNVEVPAAGEFAKALRPMEASIKITPTVTLTNTLPYYMEGYMMTMRDGQYHGGSKGDDGPDKSDEPGSPMSSHTRSGKSKPRASVVQLPGRLRPAAVPDEDAEDAERAAEEREHDWCLQAIDGFNRLGVLLKKTTRMAGLITQLPQVPGVELKKQLLAAMRSELRWASRRACKDLELLFRTDLEKDTGDWDKVSWLDIQMLIAWVLDNVTPIYINQGDSQSFYIDLTNHVYVALRVPDLNLQSSRPFLVNIVHSSQHAKLELPQWAKLLHTPASTDHPSRNAWDLPHTLRTTQLRQAAEQVIAAAAPKQPQKQSILSSIFRRKSMDMSSAQQLAIPSAQSWTKVPDQLVRVALIVTADPSDEGPYTTGKGEPLSLTSLQKDAALTRASLKSGLNRILRPHVRMSMPTMLEGDTQERVKLLIHVRPEDSGSSSSLRNRLQSSVRKMASINKLMGNSDRRSHGSNADGLPELTHTLSGRPNERLHSFVDDRLVILHLLPLTETVCVRLEVPRPPGASVSGLPKTLSSSLSAAMSSLLRKKRNSEAGTPKPAGLDSVLTPPRPRRATISVLDDAPASPSRSPRSATALQPSSTLLHNPVGNTPANSTVLFGNASQHGHAPPTTTNELYQLPELEVVDSPELMRQYSAGTMLQQVVGSQSGTLMSPFTPTQHVRRLWSDNPAFSTGSTPASSLQADALPMRVPAVDLALSQARRMHGSLRYNQLEPIEDASPSTSLGLGPGTGNAGDGSTITAVHSSPADSGHGPMLALPEVIANKLGSSVEPFMSMQGSPAPSETGTAQTAIVHSGRSLGGFAFSAGDLSDPDPRYPRDNGDEAESRSPVAHNMSPGSTQSPFATAHAPAAAVYSSAASLPPLPPALSTIAEITPAHSTEGALSGYASTPRPVGPRQVGPSHLGRPQLEQYEADTSFSRQSGGHAKLALPLLPLVAETSKEVQQVIKRVVEPLHDVPKLLMHEGSRLAGGIKDTSTHIVGEVMDQGTKLADHLVDTGVHLTKNIVDKSVMLAGTGKETVDQGVKWMQWGMTKVLAQGGRRRRGQGKSHWDDFETHGSFAAKVELRETEGELCPRIMYLGINNSRAHDDNVCHVSIYAPFWIDNRTGFDLVFRDLDVPTYFDQLPFLLHHPVRAPGHKKDAAFIESTSPDRPSPPPAPAADGSSVALNRFRKAVAKVHNAMNLVKPALLNDQGRTAFKLNDMVGNSDWSDSFRIAATGNKFDVVLHSEKVNLLEQASKKAEKAARDKAAAKGSSKAAGCLAKPSTSSTAPPGEVATAGPSASETTEAAEGGAGACQAAPEGGKPAKKTIRFQAEAVSTAPSSDLDVTHHGDETFGAPPDLAVEGRRSAQRAHVASNTSVWVQRQYLFAVEIWPGPSDSVFRHTKVITIKNKYIIMNDTGLSIMYKQKGTPDPDQQYGPNIRFAGMLPPNARSALHWDNHFLPQELVIRPVGDDWLWSGSFKLPEREEYFGLRIRRRSGGFTIIPVNITVGAAGSVLVTLKSERSVPPYMIVNRCKDVMIRLKQVDMMLGSLRRSPWDGWDEVPPNSTQPMPFAWDEPNGQHTVRAVAYSRMLDKALLDQKAYTLLQQACEIPLDDIMDDVMVIYVQQTGTTGFADARGELGTMYRENMPQSMQRQPSRISRDVLYMNRMRTDPYAVLAGASAAVGGLAQGLEGRGMTLEARERMDKMARMLARECAKRVYVSIYAEGPTRVLCFAEEKTGITSVDDDSSVINLMIRLRQIKSKLLEMDDELGKHLQAQEHTGAQDTTGPTAGHSTMMRIASASNLPVMSAASQPNIVMGQSGLGAVHHLPSLRIQSAMLPARSGNHPGTPGRYQANRLLLENSPGAARSFTNAGAGRVQASAQASQGAVTQEPSFLGGGPADLVQHESQLALAAMGQATVTQNLIGTDIAYGGDLKVRIVAARNLLLPDRSMHTYAKVTVRTTQASGQAIKDQVSMTNMATPTINPEWNHEDVFRDVPSTAELVVEVWAMSSGMGQQDRPQAKASKKARAKQHANAVDELSAGAVFLGCVELPLRDTVPSAGRMRPLTLMDPITKPLVRRAGSQAVRGELEVAVEWQFTREGLLQREVEMLELIVAEKMELVARLKPVAAEQSQAWLAAGAGDGTLDGVRSGMDAMAAAATHTQVFSDTADAARDKGISFAAGNQELEMGAIPRLNAQQISESYFINLEVRVLEVRNLTARGGWQQEIVEALGGAPTLASSQQVLPVVQVTVAHQESTHTVSCAEPNLNPRFANNRASFENLALNSMVSVKVWDQKGLLRRTKVLLGEAELVVGSIPSASPTYVWIPVHKRPKKLKATAGAHGPSAPEDTVQSLFGPGGASSAVQVFLRLQITKPPARGVKLGVTLDLAGVGLCAKSSVYELLNFTLQHIKASMLQTARDLQLSAIVTSFQLDNQMLETLRPVVLSPLDASAATAARRYQNELRFNHQSLVRLITTEKDKPLITFQVVRSFGVDQQNKAQQDKASTSAETGDRPSEGQGTPGDRERLSGTRGARAGSAAKGQTIGAATILSFKKLEIELGPLDFITDQHFLEAVYMYVQTLPTANIWQDARWQEEMDVMQGLHTSSTLAASATRTATNMSLGGPSGGTGAGAALKASPDAALSWLLEKEDRELLMMRGQSSTWFFIEELSIGVLSVNVTLSLNSNIDLSSGSGEQQQAATAVPKRDANRTILKGVLTRLSGSTGFQLINVTNAPIILHGKRWNNLLVNKVGLVSLLWRHYSWPAMAEARKILGGAGPAIAAVPASLLWAGISIVELGRDVATKRVGATAIVPRLGFYGFTTTGQIVGVASRTMGAVMAMLPIQREGWLSDNEALRRYTRRPQTIVDALYLSQKDFVMGFMAALAGPVLDPYEGVRSMPPGYLGGLGFFMGLAKSILGLGVRPAAGVIESFSKVLQGIGLMCLGKRGIQGKLLRRVQAPGTPMQNTLGAVGGVSSAAEALASSRAQIVAAWQASLEHIAPALAEDTVLDVVAARPTRVVLLSNRHMAYLYARTHAHSDGAGKDGTTTFTYKLKWFIPNDLVDNIRGVERTYRISIEFRKLVQMGRLVLKLPLRKGMRCMDPESHHNLLLRLNRHIVKHSRQAERRAGTSMATTGMADTSADLTIALPPAAPTTFAS